MRSNLTTWSLLCVQIPLGLTQKMFPFEDFAEVDFIELFQSLTTFQWSVQNMIYFVNQAVQCCWSCLSIPGDKLGHGLVDPGNCVLSHWKRTDLLSRGRVDSSKPSDDDFDLEVMCLSCLISTLMRSQGHPQSRCFFSFFYNGTTWLIFCGTFICWTLISPCIENKKQCSSRAAVCWTNVFIAQRAVMYFDSTASENNAQGWRCHPSTHIEFCHFKCITFERKK